MTPSERERVTEVVRAAEKELLCIVRELGGIRAVEKRAERAEAAARDFASALREIQGDRAEGHIVAAWDRCKRSAGRALGRHPSFSGEEGTD